MIALTGINYRQHSESYTAQTTSHPFRVNITADQAREIIGRAFNEGTIQTIMQWGDDQVISMSLTELMELEEAMEVIADELDYWDSVDSFLAGTKG